MFHTLDMRAEYQSGDPGRIQDADEILERYYQELQKAFPLKGEIETPETYREYLSGSDPEWYMLVLRTGDRIIGGAQYQILRGIKGEIQTAAWFEHVFILEKMRTKSNFVLLMKSVLEKLRKAEVPWIFMEFNDPAKMTDDQKAEDAKAGVLTNDRVWFWGALGLLELVTPSGTVAPYAQPGMDGPAVEYLTVGWFPLFEGNPETISGESYLAIINRAHSTIPGVDPDRDPTCLANRRKIEAIPGRLSFQPLSKRFPARESKRRIPRDPLRITFRRG